MTKAAAQKRDIQKPKSFQEIILKLSSYWSSKGCAILQPYDMEVGAGTLHPSTTLIASDHPVAGIWYANQPATAVPVEDWRPEIVLVHRSDDVVAHTIVDADTHAFLLALFTATSLEAALLDLPTPAAAGAALMQCARLMQAGALVAAIPPANPQGSLS